MTQEVQFVRAPQGPRPMVVWIQRVLVRVQCVLVLGLVAGLASQLPAQAQSRSKTEQYVYEDNPANWVMGQVKSVTCVSSTEGHCANTVVAAATYDTATATQLTVSAFGKLRQTLTYNPDGTVATVKDGNNQVTQLGNWYRGIPRTITHPDTKVETAEVDDRGWITSVTDEGGAKSCYQYDAMGRLQQLTHPSETQAGVCDTTAWSATAVAFTQIAAAEYGLAAGHWRQTVTTGNGTKKTYFDGQWRPVLVWEYDAANVAGTQRFQRIGYDHEGRTTFESYHGTTDGLASGKRTHYDPLGRVTQIQVDSELGTLTTATEYLSGFRTRMTDARGQATTHGYQTFDQPQNERLASVAHPEGAYSDIVRDAYGKAQSIVRRDAGNTVSAARTYTYNSHQELCRTVEPETGATLNGYDGAGNLKWTAAGLPPGQACEAAGDSPAVAARRVDRSYDARNRIQTLSFPDGKGNQGWTYTPVGQPETLSVANPNVAGNTVTTYGYFRRGQPRTETVVIRGSTYTTTWDYNASGHLSSQGYPSGLNVSYAPNALGQPTQAGAYASQVSYFANGAIKGFTYGNGVVHTMQHNARQLPSRSTDCKVGGACAVSDMRQDLSYTYDPVGNVTGIVDGLYGRQDRSMQYDGQGRLTAVSSAPMFGAATYTYDVLDNLRQTSISGGSAARAHFLCYDGANRLASVRTGSCAGTLVRALSYDVQGNLSAQAGQSYVFDFGNRLREVPGKEWYAYDGHGHRVASCGSPGCAHFVYSSKGSHVYTHDARNNKYVDHVYLGGRLVALRERAISTGAETVKYQHTDMLGTPIAVTGSDRSFITKHEYEPYGQMVNGTLQDGPGYTGHVQDAATGLTYMQQRYYDPLAGRFLSADPVATDAKTAGHLNRYVYGENNPYKYRDPDGRAVETPWDAANVALGVVSLTANLSSGNFVGAAVDAAGVIVDLAATAIPGAPGGAAAAIQFARAGGKIAAKGAGQGEKLLFRRGPHDSKDLLASQSRAAENAENIGVHGVSVSTSPAAKPGQVVRCATCSSVEAAGFKVHKTGNDPHHHTVELPKPVTSEVARRWNELFK